MFVNFWLAVLGLPDSAFLFLIGQELLKSPAFYGIPFPSDSIKEKRLMRSFLILVVVVFAFVGCKEEEQTLLDQLQGRWGAISVSCNIENNAHPSYMEVIGNTIRYNSNLEFVELNLQDNVIMIDNDESIIIENINDTGILMNYDVLSTPPYNCVIQMQRF